MYWVRTINLVYPDGNSEKKTYLLCDSFEEFTEDTVGIVGVPCIWDAQIGELKKAEAREKAKKEYKPLTWEKNPFLLPAVKSVMKELGAIISTTVVNDLYGIGREEGMREVRELVINKKVGKKFHIAKTYIPGYESIFDGTINKEAQCIVGIDPNYVSDYAFAYLDIGLAYKENHDYNRAIENCSQSIKIDPNYLPAYYNRGGNYFMNDDFDNAINDLTQCLKIDPLNETVEELLQRINNKKRLQK